MKLKLVEDIINKIEYKSISNIDKFKQYADEILGDYGQMSDSDIKEDIKEIYIDGELKGYIGLSKYNEEDGTKLLGIGNFMIIERGKGYGTQVINDIVSKYKSKYDLIYCFVDSDNEGAISLYKKLGKVYDEDGPNDNGQYYVTFYDNGKYKLEENYDPPYNAQQIKDNYGIDLYNKLIKDPAHRWRMKTGIELIHKEPTKEELERIWKNWQEMSEEQKEKSDKKSLELFGKTNEENYYDLIKLYESVDSNKDIDDIETPEQLMIWMEKNISYELANDEYDAEDDPLTKTAEEVIQSGTGHCAEQSYLEYKVLDELGYFPQLIFVKENNSEDDYGADGSAHMFVVYQDDDEKYTYFEHSQEHNKGIHKFDSMSELLDFVGKNWWRYDANSDILEVRYIDEPITGVNNWELAQACYKYPVDEILDISNNIMEKDVPSDAKWDPYKHQIIEESLTEASFKHSYKTAFGISNQYRGFTVVEAKNNIAVYDGLVTDQNLVESNFKSLDDAKLYIDLITGYARKPFNADYKYSIILLLSAGLDEKLKSMIEDGIKLRNISKKSDDLDFYIQIGSKEDNLNNIIKKYDLQDYIVNFRKKSDYSGPQSSQSIKDLLRLGHASRREDAIAYYDNLTEAKKSKKKKRRKLDHTEFNTPAKLKAWAKKRQKGLSPFTYLNTNAGNVEYNNSMFNQMMGNNNSNSSTDSVIGSMPGGISNGGLSSGEAASTAGDGGGMAMGEALSHDDAKKRYIENGSKAFLEQYKDLLDDHLDKFIGELFKIADVKVYLNLIKMLKEADIELPTAQQVLDAMIEMGYVTRNSFVIYNQLAKDLG